MGDAERPMGPIGMKPGSLMGPIGDPGKRIKELDNGRKDRWIGH